MPICAVYITGTLSYPTAIIVALVERKTGDICCVMKLKRIAKVMVTSRHGRNYFDKQKIPPSLSKPWNIDP